MEGCFNGRAESVENSEKGRRTRIKAIMNDLEMIVVPVAYTSDVS